MSYLFITAFIITILILINKLKTHTGFKQGIYTTVMLIVVSTQTSQAANDSGNDQNWVLFTVIRVSAASEPSILKRSIGSQADCPSVMEQVYDELKPIFMACGCFGSGCPAGWNDSGDMKTLRENYLK